MLALCSAGKCSAAVADAQPITITMYDPYEWPDTFAREGVMQNMNICGSDHF
jgi:hypothetical protein